MSQYRCVICGSEIEPLPGSNVAVCPNCETRQEIPDYQPTPQQQNRQTATDKPKRKSGLVGGIIIGMIIMLCIIALVVGVFYFFNNSKKTENTETGYISDEIKQVEIGDYIEFGTYEQDGDESNGAEPIEWLVLDKEDDRILVISKYGLDCKLYDEEDENATWEECTLREWLNDDFLNSAFTEEEIGQIPTVTVSADENPKYETDPGNATEDKIFLLSIDEANTYFGTVEARACQPTKYAMESGASCYEDTGNTWWWLRTPGIYQNRATFVYYDGSVALYGHLIGDYYDAVRPAMWIDLNS